MSNARNRDDPQGSAEAGKAARVLIVEDEGLVALELEDRIAQLGHEVCAVVDSEERAVEAVQRLSPDLVLMDIRLRGRGDGVQAAERIRKVSDVPIVFVTAHADAKTIDRVKHVEPHGFLVKPFDERALAATVVTTVHRRQVELARQTSLARSNPGASALEQLPVGLAIVDEGGSLLWANREACSLLGWVDGAPVGEAVGDLLIEASGDGGERRGFVPRAGVAATRCWPSAEQAGAGVEVSAFEVADAERPLVGLVFARAAQGPDRAAIAALAGRELGQVLGEIGALAAHMRMALRGKAPSLELVAIERAVARGEAMSARIARLGAESQGGQADVRAALERLRRGARSSGRIALEVRVPGDVVVVALAAETLDEVLGCLCDHAGQVMSDGGKLTIEIDVVDLTADEARSLGLRVGRHAHLRASDTAPPLPLDALVEGFGGGVPSAVHLAGALSLVKPFGGAVEVVSRPLGGNEVGVYLPLA